MKSSAPSSHGQPKALFTARPELSQSLDRADEPKQYQGCDTAKVNKDKPKMDDAIPTLIQHLGSPLANIFE